MTPEEREAELARLLRFLAAAAPPRGAAGQGRVYGECRGDSETDRGAGSRKRRLTMAAKKAQTKKTCAPGAKMAPAAGKPAKSKPKAKRGGKYG